MAVVDASKSSTQSLPPAVPKKSLSENMDAPVPIYSVFADRSADSLRITETVETVETVETEGINAEDTEIAAKTPKKYKKKFVAEMKPSDEAEWNGLDPTLNPSPEIIVENVRKIDQKVVPAMAPEKRAEKVVEKAVEKVEKVQEKVEKVQENVETDSDDEDVVYTGKIILAPRKVISPLEVTPKTPITPITPPVTPFVVPSNNQIGQDRNEKSKKTNLEIESDSTGKGRESPEKTSDKVKKGSEGMSLGDIFGMWSPSGTVTDEEKK